MKSTSLRWPIIGVLVAIAITTTMDANGLSAFSALPLFPLMALFWYLERLSKRSVGFTWGGKQDYGVAALHPLCVLGAMTIVSFATGVIDFSHTNWRKALLNLALVSCSTFIVAIITEEGFFRGWLWASLERADVKQPAVLICSSVTFSLWHLSAVSLRTGFDIPAAQIPVFMVNAAVMGAVWGLLRWISGSVLVASLSHGLWNGLDYVFFGFGTRIGALGIRNTALYGPEVGILGLGLNIVFLVALWWSWRRVSSAL
jgi:membrane protease YdiL (CAAX protease family)